MMVKIEQLSEWVECLKAAGPHGVPPIWINTARFRVIGIGPNQTVEGEQFMGKLDRVSLTLRDGKVLDVPVATLVRDGLTLNFKSNSPWEYSTVRR